MVKFDAPVINVSQTSETVTGHSYKLANISISGSGAFVEYGTLIPTAGAGRYMRILSDRRGSRRMNCKATSRLLRKTSHGRSAFQLIIIIIWTSRWVTEISGSYITDTNGKYSFKTADTILAESVKVETAIASAKVTATKTDTDGSVYTVYQCTDGTTHYTVKTETKTTDYATETYMTYYDGQNTATLINPADVERLNV